MQIQNVSQMRIDKYIESTKTESKTDQCTVKLTHTQKKALVSAASELDMGASTLAGKAIELQLQFLHFSDSLIENRDFIISVLNKIG
ncbi:hypothetical protein KAR10_04085 [bacterium]|nr:hypothetical protein [bacterium]